MNKTNICWCDYTWNPVTGCLGPGGKGTCNYCYAEKMAKRLRGRCGYSAPDPFMPTLHTGRLNEPAKVKKPSRVFVSSMGDLFGNWVTDEWIGLVLDACARSPQHKYFFLTKNPKRYCAALKRYGVVPDNWYFGTSVENQATADARIPELLKVQGKRFVSIEPLLEEIGFDLAIDDYFCPVCDEFFDVPAEYMSPCCRGPSGNDPPVMIDGREWLTCPGCGERFETHEELTVCPNGHAGGVEHSGEGLDHVNAAEAFCLTRAVLGRMDWIIVGAQTNPDVKPKREWIDKILEDADDAGVPVHCKDNLRRYWPDLPQEREGV